MLRHPGTQFVIKGLSDFLNSISSTAVQATDMHWIAAKAQTSMPSCIDLAMVHDFRGQTMS
jgi:hypothetical protein